jgi:hypothetical protein
MSESVTFIMYFYFLMKEEILNIIQDKINAANIGEGITHKNLTIFPLVVGKSVDPKYQTLDEALVAGTAKVTEVSDSGAVPELQFLNEGDLSVFLLDGEELVGAKQNRVLNLSILAPAHKTITIPVSCVEQGRWSRSSSNFHMEDRVMFSRGRSNKAASVSRSMSSGGYRRSDQGEVWLDIAAKSEKFRVASPTDSMSDIYEDRKKSLAKFVGAFTSAEFQVGAIFGIDGAVAGVDLFDAPSTFSKLMPKLVSSYALDAIENPVEEKKETQETEVQRFLEILSDTRSQEFPAVGLGKDLRLESEMISGGALVNDGRVVHLGAFPLATEDSYGRSPRRSRMMRSSQRRRAH